MNPQAILKDGAKMTSPVVERIKTIINDNLDSDISLSQIAEKVGISVYYMSHIFKKATGKTPVEYRSAARIEKAKEKLLQSSDSITEIAFECGFQSRGYFSERFAKFCGMSPAKYREKYKKT